MPITHAKVSGVADGPDTAQVRPSDWNAAHVGGELLGAATARTLVSNAFDATGLHYVRLSPEGGVNDFLDDITGGVDGQLLVVEYGGNPGNEITVRTGGGAGNAIEFTNKELSNAALGEILGQIMCVYSTAAGSGTGRWWTWSLGTYVIHSADGNTEVIATNGKIQILVGGSSRIVADTTGLGFFTQTDPGDPVAQQAASTVADLWTALQNYGLLTSGSTAPYDLTLGTGDAVTMYNATTAQLLGVVKGTAGSPDTTAHPLVKVERTLAVANADLTGKGDAVELLSSLLGIAVGTTSQFAQPVGVAGFAKASATTDGTESRHPDACGIYGVGRITGSGIGTGIGGYFAGRRDNDTGSITGIEVSSANYGTAAGSYLSTAASGIKGIWLNANGNADSGVGIQINNPFGRQFKVGIGFGNQVTGGLTGGVADSSIRDDSSSVRSIDIRGIHTYGIDLNSATLTIPIRLKNNTGLNALNAAGSQNVAIISLSSANSVVLGDSNAAGVQTTQSLTFSDAKNIIVGTTTGTKIGEATTQKLGFWNATPVVQPTAVADATDAATAISQLNLLLARCRTIGLIAT